MSTIKASLGAASAWLERCWRDNGSAAVLAFFIAFALVFVLGARR